MVMVCMCACVRAIDASYVDPDTMDFEGQEWVLPQEPQPKPDKVRQDGGRTHDGAAFAAV